MTTTLQDIAHIAFVLLVVLLCDGFFLLMFGTSGTLRGKTESDEQFRKRTRLLPPIVTTALVVAGVLVLDVMIVWWLMHMGGPFGASVNMTFKKMGADIAVSAGGLIGAFLAIVIVSFAALRMFYSPK